MMATKTLLTLEQFERLPDDGTRHELDEGELISMPPPLGVHGKVQTETGFILRSFVGPRSLGRVLVETGFRLGPNTVRAPDVSFIRAEQAKKLGREPRRGRGDNPHQQKNLRSNLPGSEIDRETTLRRWIAPV